jgi:UDP-3-O-[3-hydroxymyristoyl] glucosamine N-acyltransferase
VNNLSKIEEGTFGTLSFLSNPKYEEYIYKTGASICIVNKSFIPNKQLTETLTLIKVDDAYSCFAKLLEFYDSMRQKPAKIEQPSHVSETASLGENLYIGAFAYLGENVVIGNNVKIYPNPLKNWMVIDSDVTIQSIEIFDVSGKLIESKKVNSHQTEFPIALENGVYLVKLVALNSALIERISVQN